MTWKEFKESLEKEGVRDEDTIFRIETGAYPRLQKLRINLFYLPDGERDIYIDNNGCRPPLPQDSMANIFQPFAGIVHDRLGTRAVE
ncbi:hypothetical protein ACXR0O_27505 [Verrucomicrobiota bacterium sgz303538]